MLSSSLKFVDFLPILDDTLRKASTGEGGDVYLERSILMFKCCCVMRADADADADAEADAYDAPLEKSGR